MMRHVRLYLLALLAAPLPLSAQEAPPVVLDCALSTICLDVGRCRDWDQSLRIRGGPTGWQVIWGDSDLPSDYQPIADLAAPDGALAETRVISLLYANPETQSVQVLTVETDGGSLVVSGHQPQANPRAVTSYGSCEGAR